MIKPYLSNIINDPKDEWKIQLAMEISFISSKDSNETHIMHITSKNIVILVGYGTDEIIEELFESLLQKYQKALDETTKGTGHVFNCVDALYYKLHKRCLKRGGSYIDSPEWLKNKKARFIPINK